MSNLRTDKTVLEALADVMERLRKSGASARATKIKDALEKGMYPPKYIYLLIHEGQL